MPVTTVKPKILAGQSLSSAVYLNGKGLAIRIVFPSEWTPANVSFQISNDGINFADMFDFADLFDAQGKERLVSVVPGGTVFIRPVTARPIDWLKIRSGPRDNPVPQAQDREFLLTLDTQAVWSHA